MNPDIFKLILGEKLKEKDIAGLPAKEINIQNNQGNTPLHYAIITRKTNMAITLLKNDKIDFTIINKNNNTILDEAIINSNNNIIQAIIENKKITQLLQSPPLYKSAMQNMVVKQKWDFIEEVFKKLPAKELNNTNNFDIWTQVVKNKNSEDLAEEMYNKISEQINDENGKVRYLNQAIESKRWDLSKTILEDISDDVIESITFKNTFTIVLEENQLDIAKNLIEKTELEVFTNKDIIFPILEKVAEKDKWEIRTEFINKISKGLEICNLGNQQPKLLVHYAIQSENWIVADQLINELPSELLSIKSKDDLTPLHLAISKGNTKFTLNLIDKIPDKDLIHREKKYNCTALDRAIKNEQVQVVIKLIEKLPYDRINDKNNEGESAIHIALKQNNPKILQAIKFSHQGDIDFNSENHAGQTPLDLLDENSARIFRITKINNKYKELDFNKHKGDFSDNLWKEIELTASQNESSYNKLKECADSSELIETLKLNSSSKEKMKIIISQNLHKKNPNLEEHFNEYCANATKFKELKKQARIEMTNSLNSLSINIKLHLETLDQSNIKCQEEYLIEETDQLNEKSISEDSINLQNEQPLSNLDLAIKLSDEDNSSREKKLYIADRIQSDIYLFKENETKDHEYGRPAIIVGYNKNKTDEWIVITGTSNGTEPKNSKTLLKLKISENHENLEKRDTTTYFYSNSFRAKSQKCIQGHWSTNVKLSLNDKRIIAENLSTGQINILEQELVKINALRQIVAERHRLAIFKLDSCTTTIIPELDSDLESKSEDMKARIIKRAEEKRKQRELEENEINEIQTKRKDNNLKVEEQNQQFEEEQVVKNKNREELDLERQKRRAEFFESQDNKQKQKHSNSEVQNQEIQTKFKQNLSRKEEVNQNYQAARQKLQQVTLNSNSSKYKQDSRANVEKKEADIKTKQTRLKFSQNLEEDRRKQKEIEEKKKERNEKKEKNREKR